MPAADDLARGLARRCRCWRFATTRARELPAFSPPAFVQRTMGGVRDAARIELGSPGGYDADAGAGAGAPRRDRVQPRPARRGLGGADGPRDGHSRSESGLSQARWPVLTNRTASGWSRRARAAASPPWPATAGRWLLAAGDLLRPPPPMPPSSPTSARAPKPSPARAPRTGPPGSPARLPGVTCTPSSTPRAHLPPSLFRGGLSPRRATFRCAQGSRRETKLSAAPGWSREAKLPAGRDVCREAALSGSRNVCREAGLPGARVTCRDAAVFTARGYLPRCGSFHCAGPLP